MEFTLHRIGAEMNVTRAVVLSSSLDDLMDRTANSLAVASSCNGLRWVGKILVDIFRNLDCDLCCRGDPKWGHLLLDAIVIMQISNFEC